MNFKVVMRKISSTVPTLKMKAFFSPERWFPAIRLQFVVTDKTTVRSFTAVKIDWNAFRLPAVTGMNMKGIIR